MDDDAVHPVAGLEVLPQQTDRDLRDRRRVGRVHAEPRVAGGVRCPARVLDDQLRARDR